MVGRNKTKGNGPIGLSKHRKSGKNNRNHANNLQLCRELEKETLQKKLLLEKRKPAMFSSVIEALRQ